MKSDWFVFNILYSKLTAFKLKGVIGSDDSCKNSLIHYFLTRNWNWEDAPEGGRFKKEITFEGRSFLLLIRDEGSREPSLQVKHNRLK